MAPRFLHVQYRDEESLFPGSFAVLTSFSASAASFKRERGTARREKGRKKRVSVWEGSTQKQRERERENEKTQHTYSKKETLRKCVSSEAEECARHLKNNNNSSKSTEQRKGKRMKGGQRHHTYAQ